MARGVFATIFFGKLHSFRSRRLKIKFREVRHGLFPHSRRREYDASTAGDISALPGPNLFKALAGK